MDVFQCVSFVWKGYCIIVKFMQIIVWKYLYLFNSSQMGTKSVTFNENFKECIMLLFNILL